MYRGESMDSASDAGRRRAASEEAGTSTGEEEDEEAVRVSRPAATSEIHIMHGWSTDRSFAVCNDSCRAWARRAARWRPTRRGWRHACRSTGTGEAATTYNHSKMR